MTTTAIDNIILGFAQLPNYFVTVTCKNNMYYVDIYDGGCEPCLQMTVDEKGNVR